MAKNSDQPLDIIILNKGEQRYIFIYNADTVRPLKRVFTKFAQDKDLDFNWHDAATMCNKVRGKMQPLKAWRVVPMTGSPVEFSSRDDARNNAKTLCGKVQAYVPGIGWVDDSRIPEAA